MKQKLIKKTNLILLIFCIIVIDLIAQVANSGKEIFVTFSKDNDITTVSDDSVANLGTKHIQSGPGDEATPAANYQHAETATENGVRIMPIREGQLGIILLTIGYGLLIRSRLRKKCRETEVESKIN